MKTRWTGMEDITGPTSFATDILNGDFKLNSASALGATSFAHGGFRIYLKKFQFVEKYI